MCRSIRKSRCFPVFLLAGLLFFAPAALAETYELPLFVSRTDSGQQGVLRVLNYSDEAGTVEIHAINDAGLRAGPAMLSLDALASVDLEAADLVSGNGAKGLAGGLGALSGDVRLEFDTDLRIQYLARLRSADGTGIAIHDLVRLEPVEVEGGFEYLVPMFNPATNMVQESQLRLINSTDLAAAVVIEGRDATGAAATGGSVRLTLSAGAAIRLTAQQLEAGDASITGRLGAGSGSWRLRVSSDRPIGVVNLVVASTGRLDNLSTVGLVGNAPSSQSAFYARFAADDSVVIGAGNERDTLSFDSEDRFTETDEEDGVKVSYTGSYAYLRTGEDVGRLTLTYDDGEECAANLYFTSISPTSGWYASRCVDAENPDGYWTGGAWSVSDDTGPPPASDTSPTLSATGRPGDRTYSVGAAIAPITLPAATGGDGPLSYSLTPGVPGLSFDDTTRQLSGTPTAAGTHGMTYTVTDADGDTDTLSFTITVQASSGGATAGECQVGQLVSPGGSCNYPGTEDAFSVDADGRGSFLVIKSGRAININNVTFNGKRYDFRASHQGDGVWRIDRLEGSTTPPTGGGNGSDTSPEFASNASPGDQTYMVGTAIDALTLPEATGGDGTLTYSLSRSVPGLTFNTSTRRLTGTPTTGGSYDLTYTVTDADGDTDTLRFSVVVESAGGGGQETRFEVGDTLSSLPTGFWTPDVLAGGASFSSSGGRVTIRFDDGGYIEEGEYRYTCRSAAGCRVEDREVSSGTIARTSKGTAPGGGADRSPSFASGSGPGDQTYMVGTAIDALTLPEATGGDGTLTYSLSRSVPGLTFNTSTRRLTGTPTTGGSYDLTYTVTDADGDTDTLRFSVVVESAGGGGQETRFEVGDTLSSLPTGFWTPDVLAGGASFSSSGGRVTIRFDDGGYIEEGEYRYTCRSAAGCRVEDREVSSGTIARTSKGTAPGGGADRSPSFASGSGPGDQTYMVGTAIDALTLPEATGGDGTLTYSLSRSVPGLTFNTSTRRLTGTPTTGGSYDLTYTVTDADGDTDTLRFSVVVERPDGGGQSPDLVVESEAVDDSTPDSGESFTFSATVHNRGDGQSGSTTLRYYRSTNATISGSDTAVGTDAVVALDAGDESGESITLTAPSSSGTYYYGACVDSVSGESDTRNNCSSGVRVTVSDSGGGVPSHPSSSARFSPPSFFIGDPVDLIVSWGRVSGATNYKVYINRAFPISYTRRGNQCTASSSTDHSGRITSTSYTYRFTASAINSYYYFVQACNSAGQCSCP